MGKLSTANTLPSDLKLTLNKSMGDVQIKRSVVLNPINIGRQALSWKNVTPEASLALPNPKEDGFTRVLSNNSQIGNGNSTPCLVFCILAVMAIA